tara:strand:- start:770 stop:1213 length:444 start_codon:yes stop_codon:yes gene_type:complete
MTQQATHTSWNEDADWLEAQVLATQFMLGATLSRELTFQLRHAVMELDEANKTVISYAVTVRNLVAYTIEDVQANRRVLQTVTSASNDLAKFVDKRQACVDKLQLLLVIAMPAPVDWDNAQRMDLNAQRMEFANTICENAASRLVEA